MSDEELLLRLRLKDTSLTDFAADRIEELLAEVATCQKYRDAYAEMDRITVEALRKAEAERDAAVGLLVRLAAWDGCWPSKDVEGIARYARATIAELTGGKDE